MTPRGTIRLTHIHPHVARMRSLSVGKEYAFYHTHETEKSKENPIPTISCLIMDNNDLPISIKSDECVVVQVPGGKVHADTIRHSDYVSSPGSNFGFGKL